MSILLVTFNTVLDGKRTHEL